MAHKTGAAYKNGHIVHGCANAMYLPQVIRFNAKDEVAAKRYADIAKFIDLEGDTTEGLVKALCDKIEAYNVALNIPKCIKDYENGMVPEDEFLEKLPEVAALAISDACTGSNPRIPDQKQMEELLKCCYYGTEVDF